MLASLCCFSVAFLLPPCFAALSIVCLSTCSDLKRKKKRKKKSLFTVQEYRFIISNGSYNIKSVLGCAVCVNVYLTLEKKTIYEKHLYDKIPLECEARQCYDADYDDSLSPLTFSGEWSELSSSKK